MKSFVVAFFLFSISDFAASQIGSGNVITAVIGGQRAAIAAERNSLERGFLSENAACFKKYAVNSCLENVNVRRRATMAELGRQEMLINVEMRKSKAEQNIRKNEEKSFSERTQEGDDRKILAIQGFRGRQMRDLEKKQGRNGTVANKAAAREAHAARLEKYGEKI